MLSFIKVGCFFFILAALHFTPQAFAISASGDLGVYVPPGQGFKGTVAEAKKQLEGKEIRISKDKKRKVLEAIGKIDDKISAACRAYTETIPFPDGTVSICSCVPRNGSIPEYDYDLINIKVTPYYLANADITIEASAYVLCDCTCSLPPSTSVGNFEHELDLKSF